MAGSATSGGITSLDAKPIEPEFFEALRSRDPSTSTEAGPAVVTDDDDLDESYLSPPAVHTLVCVGFDDGVALLFTERTVAFSAQGLKNPTAFTYFSTLINSSLLRQSERRAVRSVAISSSGKYALVTYIDMSFACEFEVVTRRTRWEENRQISPGQADRDDLVQNLQDAR